MADVKVFAPIDDPHINQSGKLSVGNGHEIYWVDWGNDAIRQPIFYLHGGPGSGFSERDFAKFDPAKQRVIFHDQRGAGRSTPYGTTKHNTTADLVSDIVKLKQRLGFRKISLYGRSWGSTLALMYAIESPDEIDQMLLGGIYLARQNDNDFYLKGRVATHFPEVWDRFIATVPEAHHNAIIDFYRQKLQDQDSTQRVKYAKEWQRLESSLMKLDYVPSIVEHHLADVTSSQEAIVEAHYILNNCFIEENYIIQHAEKLKTIKRIVLVHGRYDFVCIPRGAYDLKQALGDNTLLHFVMGGHSGNETVIREVEQAYIHSLW